MQAVLETADELRGDPEVVRMLLTQLRDEAVAEGDAALLSRVANRLAEVLRREGHLERAEKTARQALEAARRSGSPTAEAAAWNTIGLIHYEHAEHSRAKACSERCLELSRAAGYTDGELSALNQLGILMGLQGRISDALACYERCLAIDIARGSLDGEAVSRTNVGWVLEQLGRWEEATEQFYRAIAICEREGYEDCRFTAQCNLGELFIKRRRLEQAISLFAAVVKAERAREQPRTMLGIALMHLGKAMAAKGDRSAAMTSLAEAEPVFRANDSLRELAALDRLRAELALEAGQVDEAERLLGSSARLAGELGLQRELGEGLRVRGLIFAEVGDREAARDCFERALSEFADTPDSYETARVCLQFGFYLAGQGDKVRARTLLRQAAGTFNRLSVVAESERANRLLLEIDVQERGASAVVVGLQGLERVNLEPPEFIREALQLLCAGLGLRAAVIKYDERVLASSGQLPSASSGRERSRDTIGIDVEEGGQATLELHGFSATGSWSEDSIQTALVRLLRRPVGKLLEASRAEQSRTNLVGLVYAGVIGSNEAVVGNLEVVARVADTNVPVMIRGESGTGKELIARALHDSSSRRAGPFCAVNCAAVPEGLLEAEFFGIARGAATGVRARKGKFELAAGGTVFLDEIGDMSSGLQAKLLRVLQEHEFEPVGSDRTLKTDLRIVAATNQDTDRLIRDGRFRADLYYRLNAVEVVLPALRERREDVPELTRYFVRRSSKEFGRDVRGISDQALAALLAHDWPGNIRELQHVIERAVILCRGRSLSYDDLPIGIRAATSRSGDTASAPARQACREAGRRASSDVERAMLLDCLEQSSWKVTDAARRAGFSRAQFYRLLKRHGITRPT